MALVMWEVGGEGEAEWWCVWRRGVVSASGCGFGCGWEGGEGERGFLPPILPSLDFFGGGGDVVMGGELRVWSGEEERRGLPPILPILEFFGGAGDAEWGGGIGLRGEGGLFLGREVRSWLGSLGLLVPMSFSSSSVVAVVESSDGGGTFAFTWVAGGFNGALVGGLGGVGCLY